MVLLSTAEVREVLATRSVDDENGFDVLAALGRLSVLDDRSTARELLIRLLDQRNQLPSQLMPLLQSLVREHGLFPYLTVDQTLSLADRLALEAHRPDGSLGAELVFHGEQSVVYDHLMAGENVVLSAPTSFGKSLVVDAYLDAAGFSNAVVIVPTIALMDETRRRLRRLSGPGRYKLITHSSQRLSARNLFVMTQERLLELGELPPVDFFVVDEFYKLDPGHGDQSRSGEGRSSQLNMAFDRLHRTGAQFYLLGPNITALERASDRALRATFISTGFTTVATDVERHHAAREDTPDLLAEECRQAGVGTIVFCSSPDRTGKVAEWLLERGVGLASDHAVATSLKDAADWVAQNYHSEWVVARALRAGIGIHHGRLPRALGHHMVRLFNEGRLPYLLVTSTLIEGVNTAARTVIVLDHTIARKKYDYFTFANIRGRSGRMFHHYVGRVVVFNPEPKPADLTVEIPALTQSQQAPVEVLLHLPEGSLSPQSRARLAPYFNQDQVSIDTLRSNRSIKLDAQLSVARSLEANSARYRPALNWNGSYPTTEQVHALSELMIDMLGTSGVVRSPRQLGTRINLLRRYRGDLRPLIQGDIVYGKSVDQAIDDTLNFVRNYAQFQIPSALAAAESIARDVYGTHSAVANTAAFAGELENLFQSPYTTVLEEFGLPTALVNKLRGELGLEHAATLDDVLARLSTIDASRETLHPFEREMVRDTQASL